MLKIKLYEFFFAIEKILLLLVFTMIIAYKIFVRIKQYVFFRVKFPNIYLKATTKLYVVVLVGRLQRYERGQVSARL